MASISAEKHLNLKIDKPSVCCGGDALNVAIGLAKLGNSVSVAGRVARDANGKFILNECNKYGIHASGVVYEEECATAASARATIQIHIEGVCYPSSSHNGLERREALFIGKIHF